MTKERNKKYEAFTEDQLNDEAVRLQTIINEADEAKKRGVDAAADMRKVQGRLVSIHIKKKTAAQAA